MSRKQALCLFHGFSEPSWPFHVGKMALPLFSHLKIIVEPTSCLAVAAVMQKVIDISNAKVGILISGGNVDPALFCRLVIS